MKRLIFAAAGLLAAALSIGAGTAASTPTPNTLEKNAFAVDFADPRAVLDISASLKPYKGGAPAGDGSAWYVVTASNGAAVATTRVLVAPEPPGVSLRALPLPTRPSILQIATSDARVLVADSGEYVRRSFRITIPPSASVAIAIRLQNAAPRPAVLAWTEPALASQHRRLSIFVAAVAGLIAAATLITGGLAVMTGHAAPRWAATGLLLLLLVRLSATGMFDTSVATAVGGPYGLSAMLAGLALAAGIRLVDTIAPVVAAWPGYAKYVRWALYALLGLSLLSYLGVPLATLLVEAAVLTGSSGLAAYLVHRGREGVQPARVIAPAATIFALVALAAAVTSVGGFSDNFAAPAVVGGFAAAGALLLALAIVAGEGLVIIPHWRLALANLNHHTPGHRAAGYLSASSDAFAAIGASHQGVFDLDLKTMTVGLSPELSALIGFKSKPRHIRHADWISRIHPEDREIYVQAITDFSAHTGLAFRVEFRVKSEGGRYPWFELRATMLGDAPPASRCLGLMADITSRKEGEEQQPDRTRRDHLTGLGNRAALETALTGLGKNLRTVVLAVLDVDRFKSIHTSLGDAGADAVLDQFGERLTARFGSRAQIYRPGGDSFVLVFADPGAATDPLAVELMEISSRPYDIGERKIFARASVGLALGRETDNAQDLLKNAERALLEAKRAGGANARVYTSAMEATNDSVVLETELRHAFDEDQLDVFYQPVIRLADRSVVGFEALLRWHHPTRGLVAPSDFIPHSEATGLIVPLGRFALEKAASELAGWQRFFPLNPPLFVSVNLSRRQLLDDEFEDALRTVLSRENLARGTLMLELTESAVTTAEDVKPVIERLRGLGAGIAIDDFGTGLSNFSQLKELPFDTLKIDRSFLARHSSRDDSKDAAVLRSIVALAGELRRNVIVEGVETEHDAIWVKSLGCEFAQGFCFAQPMPASEALNYLAMHFNEKTVVPASGAAGLGR